MRFGPSSSLHPFPAGAVACLVDPLAIGSEKVQPPSMAVVPGQLVPLSPPLSIKTSMVSAATTTMPTTTRTTTSTAPPRPRHPARYDTLSAAPSPSQPPPMTLSTAPRHSLQATVPRALRVPATIRTPHHNLAQLAAEVTCLYWFERFSKVQHAYQGGQPVQVVGLAVPTPKFVRWVVELLRTTRVAPNVIILALLFIHRLRCNLLDGTKAQPGSEYKLLTVALMLGNKFLDDNTYTNKTWAEAASLQVQQVHFMEVEFLSNMRYALATSVEQWVDWQSMLGRIGTFVATATRLPPATAMTSSPARLASQLLPTPSQLSPPQLRSPSASRSATVSAIPFPTLRAVPSLGPLQARKRSADATLEPPAKRLAHERVASPRSKLPALSIPPASRAPPVQVHPPPLQMTSVGPSSAMTTPQFGPSIPNGHLSYTLSTPTRPPMNPSPAATYPTPTAGMAYSNPTHTYSYSALPPSTFQYQVTPFAAASSSPLSAPFTATPSASFPASMATSSATTPQVMGHSPFASFLSQRMSPYGPVRGVNTLVAATPAPPVHPARVVPEHAMQYRPLGQPYSELRTGTLPYVSATWADYDNYLATAASTPYPAAPVQASTLPHHPVQPWPMYATGQFPTAYLAQ